MADSRSHSVFISIHHAAVRHLPNKAHIQSARRTCKPSNENFPKIFAIAQPWTPAFALRDNCSVSVKRTAKRLQRVACLSFPRRYPSRDEQNGDRGASEGSIADERRMRGVYRQ